MPRIVNDDHAFGRSRTWEGQVRVARSTAWARAAGQVPRNRSTRHDSSFGAAWPFAESGAELIVGGPGVQSVQQLREQCASSVASPHAASRPNNISRLTSAAETTIGTVSGSLLRTSTTAERGPASPRISCARRSSEPTCPDASPRHGRRPPRLSGWRTDPAIRSSAPMTGDESGHKAGGRVSFSDPSGDGPTMVRSPSQPPTGSGRFRPGLLVSPRLRGPVCGWPGGT